MTREQVAAASCNTIGSTLEEEHEEGRLGLEWEVLVLRELFGSLDTTVTLDVSFLTAIFKSESDFTSVPLTFPASATPPVGAEAGAKSVRQREMQAREEHLEENERIIQLLE